MQTTIWPNQESLTKLPNLSDYMDFRLYLKDFYNFKREQSRNEYRVYNYAMFAAAANIKSPNYLRLIINGKRNLSVDMISKFALALSLNRFEVEEFKWLVLYGQETEAVLRNDYLNHLNQVRVEKKMKSGEIDSRVWEKVPNWITWVLYAMVDQKDVDFKIESLKKVLRNKASETEIDQALQNLLSSGELVRNEATGVVKRARPLMESAEDIPVALIRKLQAELMYLGLDSLFRDSAVEREFGSLTVCLTKKEFDELKFQLRKLRKNINKEHSIKRMTEPGERVYQVNLQLFPLTDPISKGH